MRSNKSEKKSKEKVKLNYKLWLVLILLLAVTLRIGVHIQVKANDPSYGHARMDEKTYMEMAESFSKGEMPSDAPFTAPPFYSFVMGNTIFRIFGAQVEAAYIFNNLLALINIYLLFLLGRKAWDDRAGWIAALVYNLYSPFVMLEMKVMTTTFEITFALLAIYWGMLAIEKQAVRGYFISGLMVGLGVIARPTFAFYVPFYLLWLIFHLKSVKKLMPTFALIIGGTVLPVIPIAAVNYSIGHEFIPLTTTGGLNFWLGNSSEANGCFIKPTEFRDLTLQHELEDAQRMAEADTGKQMSPGEVSSYFSGKGLAFIRENPAKWVTLLYWKLRLTLHRREIGDVWDYYTSVEQIPLYRWMNITFLGIIALGGLGVGVAWGANRNVTLLLLYLLSFIIYQLAFFACTRFRLPFAAVLCIFVGLGLSGIIGKSVTPKKLMISVVIALVLILHSLMPLSWLQGYTVHGEHYNQGILYFSEGNYEKAKTEFLAEIEADPSDGRPYAQLGLVELELGNPQQGEEYMRKAISLRPDNEVVLQLYGRFLVNTGRLDEAETYLRKALKSAPGDPGASLSLAELLYKKGAAKEALDILNAASPEGSTELDKLRLKGSIELGLGAVQDAYTTFSAAIEKAPDDALLWFYAGTSLNRMSRFQEALGAFAEAAKRDASLNGLKLSVGDAYYGMGDFEKARDTYLQGLESEPNSYELYHNLALAYGRLKDTELAKKSFEKAIELKPDYLQAYYNLGNLYIALGDADNATANLEKAIDLNPDFVPALLNVGTIYAQMGDFEKARERWQRVVDIAPESNEAGIARKNLDALKGE